MIQYTIEAAQRSNLNAFLLSTDSPEIGNFALQHGCPVPFIRPPELSTDTAKSVDVLIHAVQWFEEMFKRPTHVMLLQPTSPLRTYEEINHGLDMMRVFPNHDSFVTWNEGNEPNGCLYITKTDMLLMDRRIWDQSGIMWIQPYPMTDVDTEEDLKAKEKRSGLGSLTQFRQRRNALR